MSGVLEVVQWVLAHYQEVIAYLVAALSALIALFLLVPGEQPEKALQGVVDFLSKYSKK